jgi:hypothetical protein
MARKRKKALPYSVTLDATTILRKFWRRKKYERKMLKDTWKNIKGIGTNMKEYEINMALGRFF